MFPVLCEFFGTFLLILLGNGVVANVCLNKSNFKGGGLTMITVAWGLAVMIPAYIFGAYSGAHFNPALTIALALGGLFPMEQVALYVVAQFSGAFCGAALMYFMFSDQFAATEDPATKLGVFCTSPAVYHPSKNFLCEVVATFVLLFTILGISSAAGPKGTLATGLSNIYVLGIIISIGQSFGGLTGYAINPARDWGPRLVHTIMPIPNKGSSHWGDYALIPLLGPIVGATLGVFAYKYLFSLMGC